MAGFESFLLRLSLEVIAAYDGTVPLHRWLATWFREHKKLGSRDRRGIRELVYSYFRLGKALPKESPAIRMQVALFLTQEKSSLLATDILQSTPFEQYLPDFHTISLEERFRIVADCYPAFEVQSLFPFKAPLSKGVDVTLLHHSMLRQPYVWIRVKSVFREKVMAEFAEKKIEVLVSFNPQTLAISQSVALDDLMSFQKGYFEIQDLASQRTAEIYGAGKGEKWWDCCAASGGKSLLLLDKQSSVKLTVSDIRRASLLNLEERFKRNRISVPELLVADLTKGAIRELEGRLFDGILADVPCSGSGTWSRTPEMITYFEESSLSSLQQVQFTIAAAALRYLKPGGTLVYTTCSVFESENEAVINRLVAAGGVTCEEMRIFQEAPNRADTLFAARLVKQ